MRKTVDNDLEEVSLDEEDLDEEELKKSDSKNSKKAKKSGMNPILKEILVDSVYLLVVLVLTLLFVKYVAQRTVVNGSSMNPTLIDQDNLICDKISYRFREPKRFEVIVFPYKYEENTYYIKRIIGLPGETVRIDDDGNIYINDNLLQENFGAEVIADPGIARQPITIGADEYFVLGDNRNHSSDSRTVAVGLIKKEDILGRAWVRVLPVSEFGKVK